LRSSDGLTDEEASDQHTGDVPSHDAEANTSALWIGQASEAHGPRRAGDESAGCLSRFACKSVNQFSIIRSRFSRVAEKNGCQGQRP
jgi:hypothetical protein